EKRWFIKFAGLGPVGERKHSDAVRLARAGFSAPVEGLCGGFLVQSWVEGTPLSKAQYGREAFRQVLGNYLAFRARNLEPAGPGALLEDLCRMAVHNTSEELGDEAAWTLEERLAGLPALEGAVHRVRTDNRLHSWEWLFT